MPDHFSKSFMDMAIDEARQAARSGEVPVGAVLVYNKTVIAKSGNRVLSPPDPSGHAEMLVLREASRMLGSERLVDCDLYVTLEPCTMCAGAISFARIRRLYYGASDEKGGAVDNGIRFFNQPTCHHKPDVYSGFQERECSELLIRFFEDRRQASRRR